MQNKCSIVQDLLPLYVEGMVSEDTARYIEEHLADCEKCRAELEFLQNDRPASFSVPNEESAAPLKKIMHRINRKFYSMAYLLMIFLIFLGFTWTDNGEYMMYNSLIMPIVGIFGYYVFRLKALYKIPLLLTAIDILICLFKIIEMDIYSALMWTLIYSIFVFIGIAIAFLLHFAFRKDDR